MHQSSCNVHEYVLEESFSTAVASSQLGILNSLILRNRDVNGELEKVYMVKLSRVASVAMPLTSEGHVLLSRR
jgi:hypothetical protein